MWATCPALPAAPGTRAGKNTAPAARAGQIRARIQNQRQGHSARSKGRACQKAELTSWRRRPTCPCRRRWAWVPPPRQPCPCLQRAGRGACGGGWVGERGAARAPPPPPPPPPPPEGGRTRQVGPGEQPERLGQAESQRAGASGPQGSRRAGALSLGPPSASAGTLSPAPALAPTGVLGLSGSASGRLGLDALRHWQVRGGGGLARLAVKGAHARKLVHVCACE